MLAYKKFPPFIGIALLAIVLPAFASPTPAQPKESHNPAFLAARRAFSDCHFCLASSIRDLITPQLTTRTTSPAILSTLLQIRDNITRTPYETTQGPNTSSTNNLTSIFPEIATVIDLLFGDQKRNALSLDALTDALSDIGAQIDNSVSDAQRKIWDEIQGGVNGTLQNIDWDFNTTHLPPRSPDERPGCASCILPKISTIIDRLADGLERQAILPGSVVMEKALRVVKDKIAANITPEQMSALGYVKTRKLKIRDACVFCAVSDIGDAIGGLLDEGLDSGAQAVGDVLGDIQGKIEGLKNAFAGL